MKKIIYAVFFALLTPVFLTACSCTYLTSFCEGIGKDSKVVLVEILNKYDDGQWKTYMDLKVEEVLLGEVNSKILTMVNHGTSCDLFHDRFEIGDQLILSGVDETRIDEFSGNPYLSPGGCGTSLLTLTNNTVSGNIRPEVKTQNLADFKNEIGTCAELFIDEEKILNGLYIFPNPTSNTIRLYSDFQIDEGLNFQLFNSSGQLLQQGEVVFSFSQGIDVSTYPVGVYFLKLQIGDKIRTERIVKE